MRSERGATAVLVAGAMFFLFGAAALAVDVSMFYGSARTDQTTADLSCLAGVIESADADKITMAAEFAKQNWPTMQGAAVSISGQIGVMTAAANQVTFETNVGGDPARMRVRVLESATTHFAQALGTGSVTVVQEAFCESLQSMGGPGALPFGALTGPSRVTYSIAQQKRPVTAVRSVSTATGPTTLRTPSPTEPSRRSSSTTEIRTPPIPRPVSQ